MIKNNTYLKYACVIYSINLKYVSVISRITASKVVYLQKEITLTMCDSIRRLRNSLFLSLLAWNTLAASKNCAVVGREWDLLELPGNWISTQKYFRYITKL